MARRNVANAILLRDDKQGYLLVNRLKHGAYAWVNVVRSVATGEMCVHKAVHKSRIELENDSQGADRPEDKPEEFYMLELLGSNDCFPSFIHSYVPPQQPYRYCPSIVMGYCNGGTLGEIIHARGHTRNVENPYRIPEVFVWHCVAELCKALALLHNGRFGDKVVKNWQRPIAHNDLQMDNVFLHWCDDGTKAPKIILGDLGEAGEDRGRQTDVDPRSPASNTQSEERDVRGLGNIMKQLMGGQFYCKELSDWRKKLDAAVNPNPVSTIDELLTHFIPSADKRIATLDHSAFDQVWHKPIRENKPMFWLARQKPFRKLSDDLVTEQRLIMEELDHEEDPVLYRWVLIDADTYEIVDYNPGSEPRAKSPVSPPLSRKTTWLQKTGNKRTVTNRDTSSPEEESNKNGQKEDNGSKAHNNSGDGGMRKIGERTILVPRKPKKSKN